MRPFIHSLAVLTLISLLAGCADEGATVTGAPTAISAAPGAVTSPTTVSPNTVSPNTASPSAVSQGAPVSTTLPPTEPSPSESTPAKPEISKATFGAGCFWCVEAVFQRLKGVSAVESGYTGGHVENPTYREISDGTTGHAEVAQITYDPGEVSFRQLLEVFWKTHDPTTLNQQGADHGTQYRSAVFYHSDAQRTEAEVLKKALDESGAFGRPIVTEISKLGPYYKAEDYHQNYFNLNPDKSYCRRVVGPKVEKFMKVFADQLKQDAPAPK